MFSADYFVNDGDFCLQSNNSVLVSGALFWNCYCLCELGWSRLWGLWALNLWLQPFSFSKSTISSFYPVHFDASFFAFETQVQPHLCLVSFCMMWDLLVACIYLSYTALCQYSHRKSSNSPTHSNYFSIVMIAANFNGFEPKVADYSQWFGSNLSSCLNCHCHQRFNTWVWRDCGNFESCLSWVALGF